MTAGGCRYIVLCHNCADMKPGSLIYNDNVHVVIQSQIQNVKQVYREYHDTNTPGITDMY